MLVPETRPSLILRVRDPNDADAWNQFATLYRPVILRLARRKGIQAADAEELAQQVLLSVEEAIERWQPDQKTTWTLDYSGNGQMATAKPNCVPSAGEQSPTLQLSRTEHGWRIHKLFDKTTLAKLTTGPQVSTSSSDSGGSQEETR